MFKTHAFTPTPHTREPMLPNDQRVRGKWLHRKRRQRKSVPQRDQKQVHNAGDIQKAHLDSSTHSIHTGDKSANFAWPSRTCAIMIVCTQQSVARSNCHTQYHVFEASPPPQCWKRNFKSASESLAIEACEPSIQASKTSCFFSCNCMIFSSTVPVVMNRTALTSRVCPIRCAR